MEALYQKEVARLFDVVNRLLQDAEEQVGKGNDCTGMLRDISSKLQGIERVIKQLQTEARTKPNAASRSALEAKVEALKEDWKAASARLENLTNNSERDSLFGNGQHSGLNSQEQDRLLQVNDRLSSGTDRLLESTRHVSEIEEVALGITENLDRQSAQIRAAHQKVKETMSISDQARRLVHLMERSERTKKMVMYGVTAFIGLLLLWLVWRIMW